MLSNLKIIKIYHQNYRSAKYCKIVRWGPIKTASLINTKFKQKEVTRNQMDELGYVKLISGPSPIWLKFGQIGYQACRK